MMISVHSEYNTLNSAELVSKEAPAYVWDARLQEFCNCWNTSVANIEWMLESCNSESLPKLFPFKYLVTVARSRAGEFEQDLKSILPVLESKFGFTAANKLIEELRNATQDRGGTDVNGIETPDFHVEPWRRRLLAASRDFVLSERSKGNLVKELPSVNEACKHFHRRKDDVRRFIADFHDIRFLPIVLDQFPELFHIYVECPDSKSPKRSVVHSQNGRSLYGKPITDEEKDHIGRSCRRLCDTHPHIEIALITCKFSGNSERARVAAVSNADFAANQFERELCELLGLQLDALELVLTWEFEEFGPRNLHFHAFVHVPADKVFDQRSLEPSWSSIIEKIESRCGINPQLNDNGSKAPVDVHIQFPQKKYGYRWTRGGQKYLAKDQQKYPPTLCRQILYPMSWSHISPSLQRSKASTIHSTSGETVERISIQDALKLFRVRNGLPEPVSAQGLKEKLARMKRPA